MSEPCTAPNPGSSEAITAGCLCPVLDNNHGRHVPWPGDWWINANCPLHGLTRPEDGERDG